MRHSHCRVNLHLPNVPAQVKSMLHRVSTRQGVPETVTRVVFGTLTPGLRMNAAGQTLGRASSPKRRDSRPPENLPLELPMPVSRRRLGSDFQAESASATRAAPLGSVRHHGPPGACTGLTLIAVEACQPGK
jgi:hypothetical protein